MRKNIFALSLAAFSVLLTACSSEVPVAEKKEMSAVVQDVRADELKKLEVRLESLKGGSSVSTAAMIGDAVDGPCSLYKNWQDTNALVAEYNKIGLSENRLAYAINDAVKQSARKAVTAAYGKMKAGKDFSCRGLGENQLTFFAGIAKLMDQYGGVIGDEVFDPVIVRAACLRAVKPEVQEVLVTVKKYDEGSDVVAALSHYVDTARATWHFTPAEIGIPKDVIERLGLDEDI